MSKSTICYFLHRSGREAIDYLGASPAWNWSSILLFEEGLVELRWIFFV